MKTQPVRVILSSALYLVLGSCASVPESVPGHAEPTPVTAPARARDDDRAAQSASEAGVTSTTQPDGSSANITLGSGRFVQATRREQQSVYADDEGVTLNFEQADLREFVRAVFETILQDNYWVDPQVRGTVTLHTTRPVTSGAVFPILETVLQGNGAALVRKEGVYNIVPMADAEAVAGAPSVGRQASTGDSGFGIQVVPLEHVAAIELQKIIDPLVPEGSTLRVDGARNVLILSGPRYRIEELLATIRTFDVDWLQGMSFAMFRLRYADATTLVGELQNIIDGQGPTPLSGIVRLLPVERLNAVLVIAHRPDHVKDVQRLIEQLDWGVEGSSGRRLYVYELENGKAESIADVLQQIFGEDELPSRDDRGAGTGSRDVFRSAEQLTRPPPQPGETPRAEAQTETGVSAETSGEIKIIADLENNAILVHAGQQDYRAIEAAIRRLDVALRQVLIEATIAEVTLSNTLDHGVRWFLENSRGQLGFNAPVPTEASGPGLAFAFFNDSSDITAFFDLLATESSVKFLSTPQVMVLDNQTANIRVGDQIPVTTRSSQSTSDPNAPIVTEVQYRDTGTLLSVTPRINAGGQVTLEISQEVSLPGTEPAVGGGGNVAIAQRTITSSVIVQSGQTVVLGGLILENTNHGKSGVPLLMHLPVLGKLFSTNSKDVFRTELLVTVTPRVVENQRAIQQITEELRARMSRASEFERSVKQAGS